MDERTESSQVAVAVTEAAKLIHAPRSLDDTLEAIVQATLRTVPGFDHAGITITHRNGKLETRTVTHPLVRELDDLQYSLREGPCYESIRSEPVVLVEHARHDQRWPRYMPRAVQKGLRAQLGLRLYTEDETLGGLNLYSTQSDTIDPDAVAVAELFASHAAIALGRSRHEDELHKAVTSRQLIGQATGILMERYQIDEDRAFQFLIRASNTSNIKLRDVAREVVDETSRRFSASR